MGDELRWSMQAEYLTVVPEHEQRLELKLERWRRIQEFENNGLKGNKEKKVGNERREIDVNMNGFLLKQGTISVYPGGAVAQDGRAE